MAAAHPMEAKIKTELRGSGEGERERRERGVRGAVGMRARLRVVVYLDVRALEPNS